MSVADFLNTNGLEHGLIPAGKACAFANECGLRTTRCPTEGDLKEVAFSCGAARLFSIIRNRKNEKGAIDVDAEPG